MENKKYLGVYFKDANAGIEMLHTAAFLVSNFTNGEVKIADQRILKVKNMNLMILGFEIVDELDPSTTFDEVINDVAKGLFDNNQEEALSIFGIVLADSSDELEAVTERETYTVQQPISIPLLEEIGFLKRGQYAYMDINEETTLDVVNRIDYWEVSFGRESGLDIFFKKKFKTMQEIIKLVELVTGECK